MVKKRYLAFHAQLFLSNSKIGYLRSSIRLKDVMFLCLKDSLLLNRIEQYS